MKYFTPQLYQQFNSFDTGEAERADEAWDRAEAEYKERLAQVRQFMPSQICKLSELCLHDALVLSRMGKAPAAEKFHIIDGDRKHRFPFPIWSAVGVITVMVEDEVVELIYWLSDHPVITEAPAGWRFSKLQELWLYDEVDTFGERDRLFVHRIMLSSGVTLEIKFASVIIHRFKVPVTVKAAKQSA